MDSAASPAFSRARAACCLQRCPLPVWEALDSRTPQPHRPVFMSISAVMLMAALWMALRREGGFVIKVLAVCATVGFVLSVRLLEGL